jgi:ABC-type antimicrobial peptide transport system permease subunit
MKYLSLVISKVKHYYSANKLIFILLVFGFFFSSISLIYTYGNFNSYKRQVLREDYFDRTYNIISDDYIATNSDSLKSFNIDDYSEIVFTYKDYNQKLDIDDGYNLEISTYLDNKFVDIFRFKGRIKFTEEELNSGNFIIAPYELVDYMNNSDELEIYNKTYKIIGYHLGYDIIMPYNGFISNTDKVNEITLTLKNKLDPDENTAFVNELHEKFADAGISSPYDSYTGSEVSYFYIMIIILYIISILAFMFLMKYIVDKSSYENIIYSVVGASRGTVVFLILLENIVVSFLCGSAGILFYTIFYKSIFNKINLVPGIYYTLYDYITILFIIILCTMITSLPFLYSYYKNSLIRNKYKY